MEETQQLGKRNTYAPMDASQVHSDCDLPLNRDKSLSVVDLKTFPNILNENQRSGKSGQDLRVPVLNMRGEPMMPTTPRKARKLLEEGRAKVVSRTPFVIQLLYPSGEAKQDITLGIDAGYSKIGYNAVTATNELIAGELELRNNIKKLLEKKRGARRAKRNKLWYRKPRFLNRNKPKGWLAPSLEHKLQSHIRLIEKLKKILPITNIVIEVASFDTQKMQNPEINGVEYQQGTLHGYEVREYLLEKWHRKCAYCKKGNIPLEIEHIIPKSRGGSNRVSNLTLSCHECNQKKSNMTAEEFGYPQIQKNAMRQSLKSTAFMNIIRWRIVNYFNCGWTYGYITKYHRIRLGLEKSHVNDAFVIAGGEKQQRIEFVHLSKQVRRQNRSLHKATIYKGGMRKRNTVREVKGFRRFDKVLLNGEKWFIGGLRSSGYFGFVDFFGNIRKGSVNCKKLKLIERAKGRIEEVRRQFLPSLTRGVSLPD